MTDDICGAECADGSECQHPAGSCPVPSHSDPDAENPQGRPSTLNEYEDDILEAAREGMTLAGCARVAGVAEKTLHEWKNTHEDFRKSLKRARAEGERKHLRSVNDRGSQFILERSFGYVKTEKREIDMEADVDATHDVTADFVTYTADGTDE